VIEKSLLRKEDLTSLSEVAKISTEIAEDLAHQDVLPSLRVSVPWDGRFI
jgi:hypothetical protein